MSAKQLYYIGECVDTQRLPCSIIQFDQIDLKCYNLIYNISAYQHYKHFFSHARTYFILLNYTRV